LSELRTNALSRFSSLLLSAAAACALLGWADRTGPDWLSFEASLSLSDPLDS
jgi:hypothetical protein